MRASSSKQERQEVKPFGKDWKEAVASNKMKELVEILKGLKVEFSREPDGEKRPEAPSEERKETQVDTYRRQIGVKVVRQQVVEKTTLR